MRFSGSPRELNVVGGPPVALVRPAVYVSGMAMTQKWAVYLLCEGENRRRNSWCLQFVGFVHSPDAKTAVEKAIQDLDIPAPLRGKVSVQPT